MAPRFSAKDTVVKKELDPPDVHESVVMMGAEKRRAGMPVVRIVLLAIAIVAACVWGVRWITHDRVRVMTDDAYIDTDLVMVMSRISERVDAVLVDQNTRVHMGQPLLLLDDAQERARLALAQSNLTSLNASAVAARRGTQLESELQSAQVRGNSGRVEAARRNLTVAQDQANAENRAVDVAQRNLDSARESVRAAEAEVPAALNSVQRAQSDEARDQALSRQGYVSAATLATAQNAAAQARSAYAVARSGVASAQVSVQAALAKLHQERENATVENASTAAAQAQIAIAESGLVESAASSRVPSKESQASSVEAQVGVMQAQVKLAELDEKATRITSPVDGWVSQRDVEVGQTVAPGQALVTISPANRIFVTANYKETQLSQIHQGQAVEITIDACRGGTFTGKVVGLAPVAQSALATLPTLTAPSNFVKVAQRVPVRISLPHASGNCVFRPGMSVETAVLLRSSE